MGWRSWQRCRQNRPGGGGRARAQRWGLLATSLATLLTTGCTEHGALPTLPALVEGDGDWQRIYPAITGYDLHAAWGMDADDLWVVGEQGTILHFDGQTVQPYPTLTSRTLGAIHGSARDDVWAISYQDVLHWNGRQWRQVQPVPASQSTDLTAICCLAPDEVYVGGRIWQQSRGPVIWRHDGQTWQPMLLENVTASESIRRIWRPGPGYPLLADLGNAIYELEGDSWQLLHPSFSTRQVSADLILAPAADDPFLTCSLFQIQPDGRLDRLCTGAMLGSARRIVTTRLTLIGYSDRLSHLDACLPRWLLDTTFSIRDLIQPELPGLAGRHAFAVGDAAGLLQLTWEADHSLSARQLLDPDENRRASELVDTEEILHFLDQDGILYRRFEMAWQRLDAPFAAHRTQGLPGGAVAIYNSHSPSRIAVQQADGQWLELPPFESGSRDFWIDSALRPRLLVHNRDTDLHELWGLEAMAWTRLSVLVEDLSALYLSSGELVGFSPDDLYISASIRFEDDPYSRMRLLHFDGDGVRQVLPGIQLELGRLWVGRHSGRLYVTGSTGSEYFTGYLLDGELTRIDDHILYWNRVVEADAERVFCVTPNRLYQLGATGWDELATPEQNYFRDLWAHPEQGLFLLNGREIFHRDLPGGIR
jgi:hypothetical protein